MNRPGKSFHLCSLLNRGKRATKCKAYAWIPLLLFFSVFASCARVPLAAYDFDDGTVQGWKITAVFDDQGKAFTPFFNIQHFEAAQYPNSFPNGDPLHDLKGCFQINGGQMGAWATKSGFPSNSTYWETTAYYTGLNAYDSSAWQGIKGVKATVGDNFGATPGHVTASIGVRAKAGGQDKVFVEMDASGKPLFQPVNNLWTGKWSHLTTKLTIPANAVVYQVWIKIRGDWQGYLYEGAIMIDQVEPIK